MHKGGRTSLNCKEAPPTSLAESGFGGRTNKWTEENANQKRLVRVLCASVLHSHCVGVNSLLAGDAFEAGQQSAVIVLIRLKSKRALLTTVASGQPDKMLLRFGQRHTCANAQHENSNADRCPHAPVNILSITDLCGRCGRNDRNNEVLG
jgi:hypothetical protein